jgi:hypothetical protein
VLQPVVLGLQLPWSQSELLSQAVVQLPQCALSALVSVHTPLHKV